MYLLKNWYLSAESDVFDNSGVHAYGNVWDNPEFSEGYFIQTSAIDEVNITEDAITIITHSGSHYELRFDTILVEGKCYSEKYSYSYGTKKALEILNISDKVNIDNCKNLAREKELTKLKALKNVLNSGELYLEAGADIHSIFTIFAAFRLSDSIDSAIKKEVLKEYKKSGLSYYEDIVKVPVSVHSGMFNDSILINKYGVVDYRYFPEGSMDTYHWSDNLKCIKLKNISEQPFIFKNGGYRKQCNAGVITELPSQPDNAEGLFSPDNYNGKSLLSSLVNQTEEFEDLATLNEEPEDE